jgi:hypothetical protein
MTGSEVLAIPMKEGNDADAGTIKEYLIKLLHELWSEGEGFSGKRPFGNSGWEYELYLPLVSAGAVKGKLDSEGYLEHVDTDAANAMIFDAIGAL